MDAATSTNSDDALRAIANPLERALRIRAITAAGQRLTTSQQQIYREAIAELRGDNERKQIWIARKLGLTRGRVGQLLSRPKTTTAVEVSA